MSQRIVVGIDASTGGRQALAWALEEGALRGAEVEAVYGWAIPWTEGLAPTFTFDQAAYEVDLRAAMAEVIAEVRSETGAEVEPKLTVRLASSVASALLEVAEGADLVVVGSRGHSTVVGLALGSVSNAVVHRAKVPVVVVRGDDD